MGWELSTGLSGRFAQATEDTRLASSAPGMSLERSEVSLSPTQTRVLQLLVLFYFCF